MSFDKRTLLVAPETDLYYSGKETEAVVNTLGANLLNGNVEIEDLLDRIRTLQPELIIFSSHGTKDGILLSDGIVGADVLKPILGTTRAECVYLNTCDSSETARKIHGELPVTFIASVQEVPDQRSFVTMSAFAHHLSQGKSYQNAWILSRAGNDVDSQFFPPASNPFRDSDIMGREGETARQYYTGPTKRNGNGEIADLHEEVSRLSYLIYGNKQWNLTGILPTIAKLQRDCHQVRLLLILLLALVALLMAVAVGWMLPL